MEGIVTRQVAKVQANLFYSSNPHEKPLLRLAAVAGNGEVDVRTEPTYAPTGISIDSDGKANGEGVVALL